MEEFDFDYHTLSTQYPENAFVLQLGGGYTFTASPSAPDQRVLTLAFNSGVMRNYWNAIDGTPDTTTDPKLNFYRLEEFYQRHGIWKSFNYEHPQYGMLVVKFSKPLITPKALPQESGRVEGFSLEFREQP